MAVGLLRTDRAVRVDRIAASSSRPGSAITSARRSAVTGNGKVYARAGDFAGAVKRGEVTLALVDATYLAATGGNYTIVAAALRDWRHEPRLEPRRVAA